MKTIKPNHRVISLALLLSVIALCPAAPVGTSFTYQGKLAVGTNAAAGLYDFSFALFDDAIAGVQKGPTIATNGIPVTNGLFTVGLDFGSVFGGGACWMAVSVKTNGAGSYTALTPRQPLAPVPYAIAASGLSSNVNQTFTGTIAFSPASGSPFTVNSTTKVANLNADLIDGLDSTAFWKLAGNAATIPGVNFLGTVDNQPLELKVNGTRALRLEPTFGAPNVIGGSPNNSVISSASAFIGGGEANSISTNAICSVIAGGTTNTINYSSSFSVICGGRSNLVGNPNIMAYTYAPCFDSFIGGGTRNAIELGQYATIGGGVGNSILDWVSWNAVPYGDTIAGGASNSISCSGGHGGFCTIGGGSQNQIHTTVNGGITGGTVAGGEGNLISYATGGSIGGGLGNIIDSYDSAVIAGGAGNRIGDFPNGAGYNPGGTIGGGYNNYIVHEHGTIGGGTDNRLAGPLGVGHAVSGTISGGQGNAVNSTFGSIGGGSSNLIDTNAAASTVSGGLANRVVSSAVASPTNSTVGGGVSNSIYTASSVISGGARNSTGNSSSRPYEIGHTVGGGVENVVNYEHTYSTIGGGRNNLVDADSSTIAGGNSNQILWSGARSGDSVGGGTHNTIRGSLVGYSTIAGGLSNSVSYDYAAIAGGFSNRVIGIAGSVPGGDQNTATHHALAAGHRAQATTYGSFVWADATEADFASTANNQFLVRASGGVGINTASPGAMLDVRGDVKMGSSGQYFASGGSENLKIIRGVVRPDGTIYSGSGFTVAHSGTGTYSITFDQAFADAPALILTPYSGAAPNTANCNSGTPSGYSTIITWSGSTKTDMWWNFVAIGAR